MKVQAALRSVHELDIAGQTLVLRFTHVFARDLVSGAENRGPGGGGLGRGSGAEGAGALRAGRRSASVVPCANIPPAPVRGASDDDAFLQGRGELGAVVKKLA